MNRFPFGRGLGEGTHAYDLSPIASVRPSPACGRGSKNTRLKTSAIFRFPAAPTLNSRIASLTDHTISPLGLRFRSPALWIKDLRIGEITWVVLHHIGAQENQRVRGNAIGRDFVIPERPAPHRPCGRIEPDRFGQNHARVA